MHYSVDDIWTTGNFSEKWLHRPLERNVSIAKAIFYSKFYLLHGRGRHFEVLAARKTVCLTSRVADRFHSFFIRVKVLSMLLGFVIILDGELGATVQAA